jgi:hypothetical protein
MSCMQNIDVWDLGFVDSLSLVIPSEKLVEPDQACWD